MYIKITDKGIIPYSISQFRQDNYNISFPKDIPDNILAEYNIFPLANTEIPEHDSLTQRVEPMPPINIDGVWYQQWNIVDLSTEQKIINLKNARASAYSVEADNLFFKAQRGEATISEWQNKISDIRARYPYPEV